MTKLIKVLVLGKSGMLGSMVFHYLSNQPSFKVIGTERDKFNVEDFLQDPSRFFYLKEYDFIINCIGIIKPYCKDNDQDSVTKAIKINSLFPNELAKFCQDSKVKIIQIATDCVFSGKIGHYNEEFPHDPVDVYGMSKSLGEVHCSNFLNIRCSVIGPEFNHNLGLLGWFLKQKKGAPLKGYVNHKWNGVTTLQFAQVCEKIIGSNVINQLIGTSGVFHFCPNGIVTKYDLLLLFNKIFKKHMEIEKVKAPHAKDMTLSTKYKLTEIFGSSSLEQALNELNDYMKNSKAYKY